jgi:glycosyltransferase involved in cell wall biosynthesis
MTGERVLFVANDPPGRAVYRYRCANLAEILRDTGFAVDVAYIGDRRVPVDHDVVVLHRICDVSEGRAFARAARACGATLVYGADDLVFDPDAFPDPASTNTRRLRQYAPLHAAMARLADAVLVSTERLADHARRTVGDKPIRVVRNFLSRELFALSEAARAAAPPHSNDRVTLGYLSGTPTHDADLASIAGPLIEVLQRHENVDLLVVGPVELPRALSDAVAPSRIRRQPFAPYRDLPGILAKIDINLAPLDLARPLNHAKSEIKLLEAGAVGVPTIASSSAGFCEALASDPTGGLLAANTADWKRALDTLIADPDRRREVGAAARDYVRRCATADAHAPAVAALFAEFADLPRPRPAVPRASRVGSPLAPKYLVKAVRRTLGGR